MTIPPAMHTYLLREHDRGIAERLAAAGTRRPLDASPSSSAARRLFAVVKRSRQ